MHSLITGSHSTLVTGLIGLHTTRHTGRFTQHCGHQAPMTFAVEVYLMYHIKGGFLLYNAAQLWTLRPTHDCRLTSHAPSHGQAVFSMSRNSARNGVTSYWFARISHDCRQVRRNSVVCANNPTTTVMMLSQGLKVQPTAARPNQPRSICD